jgi:hypothetical protein
LRALDGNTNDLIPIFRNSFAPSLPQQLRANGNFLSAAGKEITGIENDISGFYLPNVQDQPRLWLARSVRMHDP